jgi:hypothetical protein
MNSLFTVVASACNGADEPLRGVTTQRHCEQVTRKITSELTLMAHVDVKTLLELTIYNQRAWT